MIYFLKVLSCFLLVLRCVFSNDSRGQTMHKGHVNQVLLVLFQATYLRFIFCQFEEIRIQKDVSSTFLITVLSYFIWSDFPITFVTITGHI